MNLARPAFVLFTTFLLGAQEPLHLQLQSPAVSGGATLTEALKSRRTIRTLAGPGLTLAEAGQLFWAAQGENRRGGRRTVPSAHASYPVEMYLLTAGSETLPAGFYQYRSTGHLLNKLAEGNPNATLGKVKGMQPWIAAAPAVFVVAGVPTRIDASGKGPALTLTYYEGGAAAQCLLLQAAALNLDAATAAGLDLGALGQALKLPAGTQIMTLLPVGREKNPNS